MDHTYVEGIKDKLYNIIEELKFSLYTFIFFKELYKHSWLLDYITHCNITIYVQKLSILVLLIAI